MPALSITSRNRLARSLLAVALVVALASCGADSLLGLDHSWGLQTVNGSSLPFTVPNSGHVIVINSAITSLGSDGNYTLTFTGTTDGTAGHVGSDQGTWTITSSTFIFRSSTLGGRTYIAALVGNTYRAAVPGQLIDSSNDSFDMLFAAVQ